MRNIWIVMVGFFICALVSPGIAEENIRLTTPQDGYFVGSTPVFKWRSISDAEYYTLGIYEDEECKEEILKISEIEKTEWGGKDDWSDKNQPKLDIGKEYFWKVTAGRNYESEMRSFTVGYTLSVKVIDDAGDAVVYAKVSLKFKGNEVSSDTTQVNGTANVYGIGEYTLHVYKYGFPPEEQNITLDKDKTFSVTLTQMGDLIINVTDEEGNPVEPDKITLTSTENGTENPIDTTNSITKGTYKIKIEKEGFEPKTIENVEITAKEKEEITCTLERLKHTIVFKVTDENSEKPVQLASIFLDGKFMGNTDENGELEIPNVEQNNHQIRVIKDEYEKKEISRYPISNSDEIAIEITPSDESPPFNFLFIIPLILSIILLVLYIRTDLKLKKVNNRLKSVTEKQKKDLKESKKKIKTMEKYVSRILEKT